MNKSKKLTRSVLALLLALVSLVSSVSAFAGVLDVDTTKEDVVYLSKIDHNLYEGKKIGTIKSEKLGINTPLLYGTTDDTLWKGGGLHSNSSLPGFATPGVIAGHARVCFKGFAQANIGDVLTVNTYYGNYKYRISNIKFYNHNAYNFGDDTVYARDQLIFYVCYPYPKTEYEKYNRIFYYADRISGPKVIDDSVGNNNQWAIIPSSGKLSDIGKYTYPSA